MANVGQLTIEMAANVARLQKDMNRATKTVEGSMAKIRKSAGTAMKALGAIGVGLSVRAFKNYVTGAIDAADATAKLSQKIGVAVSDLAGMQLAYRQAGVKATGLQTSMQKLAQSMSDSALEGGKALAALGIQVKTLDGSLKSQRAMLGEIADKLSGYRDGAEKTAIAMAIFGRAGADLLPLLNAGSKNLEQYDALAQRLGLTLDLQTAQAAEHFNDTLDLVGQSSQGVARKLSAALLPTLQSLASSFYDAATGGDALRKTADALAFILRGLYSAGVGVVEVFSSVGKVIGADAAAIVQILKGDLRGALTIISSMTTDLEKSWMSSAKTINNAWENTGNTAVAAAAKMVAAAKQAAPTLDAGDGGSGDSGAAAEKTRLAILKEREKLQLKIWQLEGNTGRCQGRCRFFMPI